MSGIKNPIISSITASAFPITGLTQNTFQALRLFVPSPAYCFSNTSGTTRSVQDGPVALWRDVNNIGVKNLITNPMIGGVVTGTPGTVPTGWRNITSSNGVSRSITAIGSEIVAGRLVNFIEYRFTGTVSGGTATCFMDPVLSDTVPASLGQQYVGSVYLKLVSGSLPTGTNVFSYIETTQRVSTGAPSSLRKPITVFNSLTIPQGYVRFSNSNTIDDPLTTGVSLDIRVDIPVIGTVVDFTLRIAAPQLERGRLTPTEFEYSSVGVQAVTGFQPRLRRGAKNLIPNSTVQGASSGVNPTGWTTSNQNGISVTCQGRGTENVNGTIRDYVDFRYQGTSTAGFTARIDPFGGNFPAGTGQLLCFTSQVKLLSGTIPSQFAVIIAERTSTGTLNGNTSLPSTLTNNYTTLTVNRTLTNATSTQAQIYWELSSGSSGLVVDFTIRISTPQLELGVSTPSVYAPTSGAPASNGIGNWWLDFDGVQTRMDFTSPIYTSDAVNTFGVAAAINNVYASTNFIVSSVGTSTNSRTNTLAFNPRNLAIWRDNSGVEVSISNLPIYPTAPSQPIVLSGRRTLNSYRSFVNNDVETVTNTLGNTTVDRSFIGYQNSAAFLNGGIYGIAVGQISPSDSEMTSIERYMGRLIGVSIT